MFAVCIVRAPHKATCCLPVLIPVCQLQVPPNTPFRTVGVLLSLSLLDIGGNANIPLRVSHTQPELTASHDGQRSRRWRALPPHVPLSTIELPVLCMIGIINMDWHAVKHVFTVNIRSRLICKPSQHDRPLVIVLCDLYPVPRRYS
jgi:hypothetical protein